VTPVPPCPCHPGCALPCRIDEHLPDEPCLWPDCLSAVEMRALLCALRDADVVTPQYVPPESPSKA
jgi:hypothetical protein